jgi:hypothetical protein
MSLINYGCVKVHIVFEMFKKYIAGSKFEHDFPTGFVLPWKITYIHEYKEKIKDILNQHYCFSE